MAMIVHPLVSQFAATLAAVMKEEVGMMIGVKDELQTLGKKVDTIRTVLEDAEHRSFTNPAVRIWISDLKNVIYDADDIIDECRTHYESSDRSAHCSCCSTSSFDRIGFRHQAGSRIRSIKERLERIIKDQSDLNLIAAAAIRDAHRGGGGGSVHRQTDPGLEPDIVGIGIDSDCRNLVRLLTTGEYLALTVLAIVGMGGIGKTTLAQKIYNHPTIRDCFRPMWVCVSQDYSDTALLREVIRAAGGTDPGVQHDRSFAELQGLLTHVIEQKKFLLILDDVWSAQAWERLLRKPLLHGAVGSRILITTRDERVAREMRAVHLHAVKPLSTNDGYALLCRMVFGCGGEGGGVGMMEDIGMQILERCHGLPLAIKTIAGVLRTKERTSREWEKVLQNPAWEKVLPDGVMGVLYLSYQDLPFHLKQCFIYCSLFREDFVFTQGYIIGHWLAQGFVREEGNLSMVEVAEEYYKDLVGRSLLQPDPRFYANQGCKMHDLLRDLAQFLARDENFVGEMDGLVKATATSCSTSKLRHLSITDYMISQKMMDHKCLRTLMLTDIPLIVDFPEDLFSKLGRLRVLDFRSTPIERLPKSVGNLRQLRYLNLSYSLISELSETIGSLSNLLYLILEGCKNLHSLPKGIVKLYNLRGFNLVGTPVTGMPVGLRGLQHLTSLIGFVTNEGNIGGGTGTKTQIPSDGWCSLEDLGYLSQLRRLVIRNLERSLIRTNSRGVLLKDKRHLSGLTMHSTPCKTDGKPYDDEEVKQIQKVFEEELFPPPSLEFLEIYGYFGLQFPSWMATSSIVSALCNLRRMDLVNFHLCKQLPPLGLLSNLDYFHINCATAVESIGPEFLGLAGGGATWDAQPSFSNIPFPKLESLEMVDMPDWVEWLWEVKDGATAMPRLQKLYLNSCPKLRSLPTGLRHATALQSITIKSANSLGAIENLATVKIIILEENPSLVRISNLPALQRLSVNACPTLREVEGLNSLTSLVLQDLAMDILPDWLLPKEGGKHPFPSLAKLKIIVGGVHTLRRFVEGGPDWPKIHHFQDVYIEANDTTNFVSYTRDPFTFRTNQDYAGECSSNVGGADVDRRI